MCNILNLVCVVSFLFSFLTFQSVISSFLLFFPTFVQQQLYRHHQRNINYVACIYQLLFWSVKDTFVHNSKLNKKAKKRNCIKMPLCLRTHSCANTCSPHRNTLKNQNRWLTYCMLHKYRFDVNMLVPYSHTCTHTVEFPNIRMLFLTLSISRCCFFGYSFVDIFVVLAVCRLNFSQRCL